jgi:hypothetical protein
MCKTCSSTGRIVRAFYAACVHDSEETLVFDSAPIFGLQRGTLPAMETYLSPRKSLIAVGVVCALSAVALLAGRTPSPTPAIGADNPTQLHAIPDLDSHAPHRK